jgi:general stress protein YciG
MMAGNRNTSNRGFASMDEDKQREIARKGGESVPDEKRSFSQDHELASEAGRKGGQASGGNFSNDRERAADAGRRGGEASHGKR